MAINSVDKVILFYNLTISIHIIVSAPRLANWPQLLAVHLVIFLLVWLIIQNDTMNSTPFSRWFHVWYPLISFLWFYPETGALRHTVIPFDLDDYLLKLETALFPQRYYFTTPLSLRVATLELLHAFYFGYYLFIALPAIVAYKKQSALVKEYIFVVTITMFSHYWFTILFPASGPVALREQLIPRGTVFIPLMNFLYATIDQGGAAFPSTHAAAAVVACWFSVKFFPRGGAVFIVILIIILISAIAGSFHYVIDIIAGILTGMGCYHLGRRLYAQYG